MSATTTTMTTAVSAAEAAAQTLAEALANYTAGYKDAAQAAAYAAGAPLGGRDVAVLESACGPERLVMIIAGRLTAFGATRLLMQSALAASGPEATAWLISQVEAHVP